MDDQNQLMVPELVTKLRDMSGPFVSVSLLIGVCWLVGTCLSLGEHTFGYVTPTDIARSSLRVCPLLLLGMGGMYVLRDAFPRARIFNYKPHPDGLEGQVSVLRFDLVIFAISILLILLFFTERFLTTYAPLLSMAICGMLLDYVFELRRARKLSETTWSLAVLAIVCGTTIGFAYTWTNFKIYEAFQSGTETVCVEHECKAATIVTRLSDATFLRWEKSPDLTILPNDAIRSVAIDRAPRPSPFIDVRPHLRSFWDWLTGAKQP